MGCSLQEALDKCERYQEGGPLPEVDLSVPMPDVPPVGENNLAMQNDLALSNLTQLLGGARPGV